MKGQLRIRAALAAAGVMTLGLVQWSQAELVYGTTLQNQLLTWDSATPGTIISGVAIQGMASNESVVGMDIRPQDGQIYLLGSFSNIYTVNPATGMTTKVVGTGSGGGTNPLLNGSSFGFDFNPAANRLRVTSNADQSLRLNLTVSPFTTIADSPLVYAAGDPNFGRDPDVTHSAYTNNFAGATTTRLYNIDSGLDVLVFQDPPNAGVLNTVGPIGTDITDFGGFDISGVTGIAYAAVKDANLSRSTFWTINLTTGAGSMVGEIDGGVVITSMTVAIPEPGSALGLAGLAALFLSRRRA
jgi:hypothetical protein